MQARYTITKHARHSYRNYYLLLRMLRGTEMTTLNEEQNAKCWKAWLKLVGEKHIFMGSDQYFAAGFAEGLSSQVAISETTPDSPDADIYAELYRLREAVKGPPGYATWNDAASAERSKRVQAEKERDALKLQFSDAQEQLQVFTCAANAKYRGYELQLSQRQEVKSGWPIGATAKLRYVGFQFDPNSNEFGWAKRDVTGALVSMDGLMLDPDSWEVIKEYTEKLGETCIDTGTCHHKEYCINQRKCFRRECCSPLSLHKDGPWEYLAAPLVPESETKGCDHCNSSLFAGTHCKNCGKEFDSGPLEDWKQ